MEFDPDAVEALEAINRALGDLYMGDNAVGKSAKEQRERAACYGAVMGRITAVLSRDFNYSDDPIAFVQGNADRTRESVLKSIDEMRRSGGYLRTVPSPGGVPNIGKSRD